MYFNDEQIMFTRREFWLTDDEADLIDVDIEACEAELERLIEQHFPQATLIPTCLELEDAYYDGNHQALITAAKNGLQATKSRWYFELWGHGTQLGLRGEAVSIIQWDNPAAASILEITGWQHH